MPKLHHTVIINRATAGTLDDYGQPSQTYAQLAVVRALIQPKSGRELALLNEAGPVRGKYRVFMYPTDVTEGDQLIHDDEVYELTFVADAGGAGHHIEADAERIWP
jgi:head-tail adaptor